MELDHAGIFVFFVFFVVGVGWHPDVAPMDSRRFMAGTTAQ